MAFKANQNPNHPKKGSAIKVEPIRDRQAIERIKRNLLEAHQYRNYCLFVLGINTAWRANELLSLNVGQVEGLRVGDVLALKQTKTNAYRSVVMNEAAIDAVRIWLGHYKCPRGNASPLFPSRQFGRLGVPAVCNLVKRWSKEAGLAGNFGSHTLRKTWGYHQRTHNDASVALLMRAFGHATEAQTLDYLCILPDEITALYLGLEL
ncbi:MAG: tyrosine-type recombinase/integrase [Pontibacterium sp.]